MLSAAMLNSFPELKKRMLPWNDLQIAAANGEGLNIIGKLTAPITIAAVEIEVEWAICDDFPFPVLIGNDILLRLEPDFFV